MNARLSQLGLVDTDRCACGEVEDWWQMLCECPLYAEGWDLVGWDSMGEDEALWFDRVLTVPERFVRLSGYVRGMLKARNRRIDEGQVWLLGGV